MKELEQRIVDQTEIRNIKPVKKTKCIKSFAPKPGQKMFQLDLSTMIITEAKLTNEKIVVTKIGGHVKRDIVRNENCIYCAALNSKNADKRFHKMLGKQYKPKP